MMLSGLPCLNQSMEPIRPCQGMLRKSSTNVAGVAPKTHAGKNSDRSEIECKFSDDQGRAWHGSGVAETSAEEKGKFNLKLQLVHGT